MHWVNISKFLTALSLLMLFGMFVKDVFNKFAAKKTNFMQSTIHNTSIKIPSFTFCFTPAMKKSMIQKYNLTSSNIFINFVESRNSDNSIPKLFNESTYQLGQDFVLKYPKCGIGLKKKILNDGMNKIYVPENVWGGSGSSCKNVTIKVERIYG